MNANGLPAIRTRAPRTPTRAGRGDERGLTDAAETRNGEGADDDGSRRGRLRSKSLAQARSPGCKDGTRDAADRYEKTKTIRAANTFSRRNRSGKLWQNEDAAAPGTPSVGGGRGLAARAIQVFSNKVRRPRRRRAELALARHRGRHRAGLEFLKRWDLVTAMFLVFVALVTPFELGFLETEVDTAGGVALFALNRVVDLVFFVDIFVQMNTMFIDSKGRKVYSRALIMRNYARTWFLVDFVSILPFELTIFLLTRGNPTSSQSKLKAVRFIRLLRLLKLPEGVPRHAHLSSVGGALSPELRPDFSPEVLPHVTPGGALDRVHADAHAPAVGAGLRGGGHRRGPVHVSVLLPGRQARSRERVE